MPIKNYVALALACLTKFPSVAFRVPSQHRCFRLHALNRAPVSQSVHDLSTLLAYGFTDKQAFALLRKLPNPGAAQGEARSSQCASNPQQFIQSLEDAGLVKEQVETPHVRLFAPLVPRLS